MENDDPEAYELALEPFDAVVTIEKSQPKKRRSESL
jgi:hypothetical protein